jgi:hypothetical protein
MDSGFGASRRPGMTSGLGRELDPAGFVERLDVEGADFGCAADIERDHDPVAGHRGGVDARTFRQSDDRVGRRAGAAGVKQAIADDAGHGGDRNERREPRYDHHQPHAGGKARRGSIAFGRRRSAVIGTGLLPFALRFSGG